MQTLDRRLLRLSAPIYTLQLLIEFDSSKELMHDEKNLRHAVLGLYVFLLLIMKQRRL